MVWKILYADDPKGPRPREKMIELIEITADDPRIPENMIYEKDAADQLEEDKKQYESLRLEGLR